jgi:predicted dinucleotide-utilizing enzyme
MRLGIIGGGTIARLFLEHVRAGALGTAQVVAVVGRSDASRGNALAGEFGVPFVVGVDALLARKPEVVVEAASHEAVRTFGPPLLRAGIALIVLSGGALADDTLRQTLERAAAEHNALLYLPSGGIGGLDALKAACIAGVSEVTIAVTKPPAAWKGIAYVEQLGVDLDRITAPVTLFGALRAPGAALSGQRQHRRRAVPGGHRLRPHTAQSRRRSGAHPQHPLHRHPRQDRQHPRPARERALARQSEDGLAGVL